MYLADRVSKVVAFMRAGYPSGMSATGYLPTAALLPRRLTEDEITRITSKLATRRHGPVSSADIGVEITRITNELPSLQDVERVQRRIAATF